VKGFPAMVIVALRELAVEFAETEKFTAPLPAPAPLEVIRSQETGLAAVQAHPL